MINQQNTQLDQYEYVMSVRAVRAGRFIADIGQPRFLMVPDGEDPLPGDAVAANGWYKAVRARSIWQSAQGEERGDILFIVHGYNLSETEVMQRHRLLTQDLRALGFLGVVVSFDWPSDDKALAYLPDRHRAKRSAIELVNSGISYLSGKQTPDCAINIHLLGHSTGALVVREAFDDADDTAMFNSGWSVSQILFAAADVSSNSLAADNPSGESVYRHCMRLTNYSNRHDEALDLSNVKRLGVEPRAGRVGLPADSPTKAVNVDCSAYYQHLSNEPSVAAADQAAFLGLQSHSWFFGNRVFTRDLFATLTGVDRGAIKSRTTDGSGALVLKR
ncbi:alpha/beta hydrolase [Crenobacter sp. SG2303]|uniref:Alpha/beta hydrolase n=1 Tax=Crenobacter oryzisoli TaxID=3056844 RepID=A0ABT7XNR3_9NEIS|nr:alpha/beta hydrolase [Crenobacter sp. SG2303]MDN0075438.1 alpha/beta hydrolase [Crenobacter sp. SG2303]